MATTEREHLMQPQRHLEGPPSVALLGTFDIANYGDVILPAVTEHELRVRIPDIEIVRYSPLGCEHPVSVDDGMHVEPLGEPTMARREEIARRHHVVLIGGGEIIHRFDELLVPHYNRNPDVVDAVAPSSWFVTGVGVDVPTVWNAVGIPFDIDDAWTPVVRDAVEAMTMVAVRDTTSARRLELIGVEREIEIVPDPGFLIPRLFAPELLERRRRLHDSLGWLPSGPYVVVQGNGSMLGEVEAVCRVLRDVGPRDLDGTELGVVVIETGAGHGDAMFAQAFVDACPGPVHRPNTPLMPADVAAIIAGSKAFIGVSMHGAITALSYGRGTVVFDAKNQSKMWGMVEHLGDFGGYATNDVELHAAFACALSTRGRPPALQAMTRRLDAYFDELAQIIERAASPLPRGDVPESGMRMARVLLERDRAYRAHKALLMRMARERDGFAKLLEDREAEVAGLRSRVSDLQRELAVREELAERLVVAENQRDASLDQLAVITNELEAVLDTKTMRWTRGLRGGYSRIRGKLR